jgi:cephalosporin hydroxylase
MDNDWKLKYPALMTVLDMKVLSKLAMQIPENSIVVEIGSRIGGSAKIILDHAHQTINLYCIDEEWKHLNGEHIVEHSSMIELVSLFPEILDHNSTYSYTKVILHNYSNVTLIPASSPDDLQNWDRMVDFVFEDSSHENPQLHNNLRFWWDKLNYNGVMAGHDYNQCFPDVIFEANLLAEQEECKLHVEGDIWWMIKKNKEI